MLPKPSSFDHAVTKWNKRISRRKAREAEERQSRREWTELRKPVYVRDEGRCRMCGVTATWSPFDPRTTGEAHRIVFRSAGGADETANLVWLCGSCHALIHQHRKSIAGNGDEAITVTETA